MMLGINIKFIMNLYFIIYQEESGIEGLAEAVAVCTTLIVSFLILIYFYIVIDMKKLKNFPKYKFLSFSYLLILLCLIISFVLDYGDLVCISFLILFPIILLSLYKIIETNIK